MYISVVHTYHSRSVWCHKVTFVHGMQVPQNSLEVGRGLTEKEINISRQRCFEMKVMDLSLTILIILPTVTLCMCSNRETVPIQTS